MERSTELLPPASGGRVAYEYLSRVVWSDLPGSHRAAADDDAGLTSLVEEGWELVNVIVPFAATAQFGLSYPGNTRKLIAFFRRPAEGGRHGRWQT